MQPGQNSGNISYEMCSAALIFSGGASTCTSPTPGSNTPGSGTKVSKTKGRTKKSDLVHHSEFIEAAATVSDKFWHSTLTSCAKKKLPRNFSYQISEEKEKYLTHRISKVSILLPGDPASFAKTCICFFQEHGKMYSQTDDLTMKKIREKEIIADLMSKSLDWASVAKSKNKRSTHIRSYVERKYEKLEPWIRKEVYSSINRGIEYKYISKDDVDFQDGEIINILGVDANAEGVFYTRQFPPITLALVDRDDTDYKPKEQRHYANWLKQLDGYKKYLKSSTKGSSTMQASYDTDT